MLASESILRKFYEYDICEYRHGILNGKQTFNTEDSFEMNIWFSSNHVYHQRAVSLSIHTTSNSYNFFKKKNTFEVDNNLYTEILTMPICYDCVVEDKWDILKVKYSIFHLFCNAWNKFADIELHDFSGICS